MNKLFNPRDTSDADRAWAAAEGSYFTCASCFHSIHECKMAVVCGPSGNAVCCKCAEVILEEEGQLP